MAAAPTSKQINVDLFVSLGDPGNDQIFLDFSEPSSLSGNAFFNKTLKLAASAVNTSVNLSLEMTSAAVIVIRDLTASPVGGIQFGADSTGTKFEISPGSATVLRPKAGSTPPTLYFSNPSATDDLYIEVLAIGTK